MALTQKEKWLLLIQKLSLADSCWGKVQSSPALTGMLIAFVLCRNFPGNYGYHEFTRATIMFCLENGISQPFSPTSSFYVLSSPSSMILPELRGLDVNVLFRAELLKILPSPMLIFFWHFCKKSGSHSWMAMHIASIFYPCLFMWQYHAGFSSMVL